MSSEQIENYIIKCEREILTTIFNNPISIEQCLVGVDSTDFLDEKNASIYAAISEIYLGHLKTVNKNTVIDYIANNSKFQFTNWQSYLEQIASEFSYEEDLQANIELVKNASIKRQLDAFAKRIVSMKIDYSKYDEIIGKLENDFLDITQSKHTQKLSTMEEVTNKYLNHVNNLRQKKQDITGTPIGFRSIDKITNGFQPGDLIILAARPGTGKTAIALNFINNAAKIIKKNMTSEKDRVVVFSLEMGAEQLCQRLISMNAKVDASALRSGKLTDAEWNAVQGASEELKTMPILIDDQSFSVVDIQAKLKQLKTQYNIKLVVIDYLQLMKGPATKNNQVNRQQEVSTISRMIKLLAKRINSPIISLAQLSRKIEERHGVPILSDLRESGSLEQDADLVCFLHDISVGNEPDEKDVIKATGPKERPDTVRIDFIIAKHRNGALKTIPMSTNRRYGIFMEAIPDMPNSNSGYKA